jgi:hypothetical protein
MARNAEAARRSAGIRIGVRSLARRRTRSHHRSFRGASGPGRAEPPYGS